MCVCRVCLCYSARNGLRKLHLLIPSYIPNACVWETRLAHAALYCQASVECWVDRIHILNRMFSSYFQSLPHLPRMYSRREHVQKPVGLCEPVSDTVTFLGRVGAPIPSCQSPALVPCLFVFPTITWKPLEDFISPVFILGALLVFISSLIFFFTFSLLPYFFHLRLVFEDVSVNCFCYLLSSIFPFSLYF